MEAGRSPRVDPRARKTQIFKGAPSTEEVLKNKKCLQGNPAQCLPLRGIRYHMNEDEPKRRGKSAGGAREASASSGQASIRNTWRETSC